LREYYNNLKWDIFSFIGQSLGGCMAILYAGVFPEKVVKLVNVDIVRVSTTRAETMNLRLRKTVAFEIRKCNHARP
jgi:pimeloyl-ACP methyl ester carboxylesterase